MLDIEVIEGDGHVVARLAGDIDAFAVTSLRAALSELAQQPAVIVDLGGVEFIDSPGLGALVAEARSALEAERSLVLVSPRPAVTRQLHAAGFDRLLPLHASVDDAAAALAEGLRGDGPPPG